MDVKRGYKQLVTLTKRVKYVMTYIKENTNINEHRRVIVKLNDKNILKSAYRDSCFMPLGNIGDNFLCYFTALLHKPLVLLSCIFVVIFLLSFPCSSFCLNINVDFNKSLMKPHGQIPKMIVYGSNVLLFVTEVLQYQIIELKLLCFAK